MMRRGVKYMLLSTFFFALMNVFVKHLSHLPAVEIAFFRSVASLGLSWVLIRTVKIRLPGNNIPALLLRGLFGATSLILYFMALQRMPLASAVTITFLAPVFTTLLGIFVVKESVRPVQWLYFLMAFAGIVMIEGFDSRVGWFEILLGIGSAVASAFAFNTIRVLKNSEHPFVIIFYFPLVTLPIAGTFMSFDFVMPRAWDWMILILIGVLAQCAQYLMTVAYQSDDLSTVSSTRYLGIIFALLFGYLVFDEGYSWQVYAGIVVVLAGVILNIRLRPVPAGGG